MQRSELLTQVSPGYALVCLLAGAVYAGLLYYRQTAPWPRWVTRWLAGLRFVLVSLLALLLLGPFLRLVRTLIEAPTIVLAVDDSESVSLTTDSTQQRAFRKALQNTVAQLDAAGLNVELRVLDGTVTRPDSVQFDRARTPLADLLGGIQDDYENRNLGGVVLLSDGLYNQGASPLYRPYRFPIVAVGLGDTTRRQDINLRALYFNKIAYQGNRFPILAEIQNTGFANENLRVQLLRGGQVLETQTVRPAQAEDIQQVTFYTTADAPGLQHYIVRVTAPGEEFTLANNRRDAYVDVIEGRERVLLLALAPHPDIKAIRAALSQKEDYELTVHIPGLGPPPEGKFDLVIAHQIPDARGRGNALLDKYLRERVPMWFILGPQSNLNRFNEVNGAVRISGRVAQRDEVTPAFRAGFTRFRFEQDYAGLFRRLPPLAVPFGEYALTGNAETILQQRVGNLVTDKPLLALRLDGNRRTAALVGEGIWQWRLQEFELTGQQVVLDELILKLVQLLSAKDDKRKFRVYPVRDDLFTSERIEFEAEVYNDLYERVVNQPVELRVTDEGGQTRTFSFVTGPGSSRFNIGTLPQGVYRYEATTALAGQRERSRGEFKVDKLALEALNVTADHDLLRTLAERSGGTFLPVEELGTLANYFQTQRPRDVVRSSEERREIIHVRWLFFVLLALVSVEWFIRKYTGGY